MIEWNESVSILHSALTRLLREESIDKIHVRDIVHEANVSRATFYRHFYDKYGLFNAGYDRVLRRTLYRFPATKTWKDAVRSLYREIQKDLRVYQNAIRSDDVNGLKNYIFRISKDFHILILRRNGVNTEDWKVEKPIESYIYGNLEVMCPWIENGMKEPIDQMQDVMDTVMPSRFRPYFFE